MKANAKEIIQKDITEVIPYDKNPRKNDNAVDKVANSIRAFGFQSPIIIDEQNVIICGHTRFKAAKKLCLKKVPCIVATGLTDAEIRAYRIADNKVGTQSNKGGLSEIYIERGTYFKTFYSVIFAPSCVKISTMGDGHERIHHKVLSNYAYPKILSERLKK